MRSHRSGHKVESLLDKALHCESWGQPDEAAELYESAADVLNTLAGNRDVMRSDRKVLDVGVGLLVDRAQALHAHEYTADSQVLLDRVKEWRLRLGEMVAAWSDSTTTAAKPSSSRAGPRVEDLDELEVHDALDGGLSEEEEEERPRRDNRDRGRDRDDRDDRDRNRRRDRDRDAEPRSPARSRRRDGAEESRSERSGASGGRSSSGSSSSSSRNSPRRDRGDDRDRDRDRDRRDEPRREGRRDRDRDDERCRDRDRDHDRDRDRRSSAATKTSSSSSRRGMLWPQTDAAREDMLKGGTLQPYPTQVIAKRTTLVFRIDKVGLKDAQDLVAPSITVHVVDKMGTPLERAQITPTPTGELRAMEPLHIHFGCVVFIRTVMEDLKGSSGAVVFEICHQKRQKGSADTCVTEVYLQPGGDPPSFYPPHSRSLLCSLSLSLSLSVMCAQVLVRQVLGEPRNRRHLPRLKHRFRGGRTHRAGAIDQGTRATVARENGEAWGGFQAAASEAFHEEAPLPLALWGSALPRVRGW